VHSTNKTWCLAFILMHQHCICLARTKFRCPRKDVSPQPFLHQCGLEVFSEFSPLGQIRPKATDDIVSNEQLWIETLQDARLMPQVGDTMFCRNSYLRLMLPSLPYPLASSRF